MDGLFPADIDLGQRRTVNGGCADPIGRQGRSRRRSRRAPAQRQTSLQVLVDIRRLLTSDLAVLRHGQTQIRQGQHAQAAKLSDANDLLHNMLGRLSRLERAAGLVEEPQGPRPARQRRLFPD